ncbi:MAG: energy transducer TonB [Azonexaceae bacterium]|uniref:energy transducer TonB n=1 Tax=Azonexus sp. R2A61 TaxID=2744443 RepID=UPI001F38EDF7|nr:energy transducer TonB [Azonexus sp. R2A61]MCE1239721.1 energy transducer TonB [Azonexaceae bacterium]
MSRPSSTQRSSLLGIVIGLHVGIFLLIVAAKTIAPQIMELPMIVDLIPAQEEQPPQAKPLPMAKPQPVHKPTPAPKTPAPKLETTTSDVPAPSAPVAPPPEPAPPAPAAPAAPAVSQARFDADYLRNPAPSYPALSRRMGEEGKVILRVSVNPQGTADSVEIRTSSGSPRLDESALKTVRNWKFIPAKRGDTAIQSWVLVPIIFKLEQ